MKKEAAADPPEDIPAWFMTYSDVITLLMTFFILLLTFATTEPEKFEKSTAKFFGAAGSSGLVGYEQKKLDDDSWVKRMRPRAARMAMQGSEMPPLTQDPVSFSSDSGMNAATEEEAKRDVMKSYAIDANLDELVSDQMQVTRKGVLIAGKLAPQLKAMPVHIALEVSPGKSSAKATTLAHHLFHVERVRPGQVSVGCADDIETGKIRFVIERYESNARMR